MVRALAVLALSLSIKSTWAIDADGKLYLNITQFEDDLGGKITAFSHKHTVIIRILLCQYHHPSATYSLSQTLHTCIWLFQTPAGFAIHDNSSNILFCHSPRTVHRHRCVRCF